MGEETPQTQSAEDFMLQVRVGPDYSTSSVVEVNDEGHPFLLDTPFFIGHFLVRVLNYNGKSTTPGVEPLANPKSEYFKGKNRRYSIAVQGRFKQEFNGDDLIFGAEFDGPIRMPTGWSLGLKVAQWLDPNIIAQLDIDKPYLFSPFLCAMNSYSVYSHPAAIKGTLLSASLKSSSSTGSLFGRLRKKKQPTEANTASSEDLAAEIEKLMIKPDSPAKDPSKYTKEDIGEWSFASCFVPENTRLLFDNKPTGDEEEEEEEDIIEDETDIPDLSSYEKRKKYFSDTQNRQNVTITPGQVHCFDFYDAYIDFSTVSLKLPGFSINAFRYWDGQPLRYALKTRDGKVLFVVTFELVLKNPASS